MPPHNLATAQMPRAVPYSPTRFQVLSASGGWSNNPKAQNGWVTSSGEEVEAETLDDAVAAALSRGSFNHKQMLLIRETGTRFIQWANATEERPYDCLHVYQIKRRSAPTYVWRDHQQHREQRLYAAPVCTIDQRILNGEAK